MKEEDFENYENSPIKKIDDKIDKILNVLCIDDLGIKANVFENLYEKYETKEDYKNIINKLIGILNEN